MKKASPQSETMFGPQTIEILRRGCATPEKRRATIQDPRALLSQHGIELPDEGELRIYERATVRTSKSPRDGGGVSEPLFDRALRQYEDLRPLPHGVDQAWRDSHGGCPYGTVPYKTKKKVTRCILSYFVMRTHSKNA